LVVIPDDDRAGLSLWAPIRRSPLLLCVATTETRTRMISARWSRTWPRPSAACWSGTSSSPSADLGDDGWPSWFGRAGTAEGQSQLVCVTDVRKGAQSATTNGGG